MLRGMDNQGIYKQVFLECGFTLIRIGDELTPRMSRQTTSPMSDTQLVSQRHLSLKQNKTKKKKSIKMC